MVVRRPGLGFGRRALLSLGAAAIPLAGCKRPSAGPLQVAVASNFSSAFASIGDAFRKHTGETLELSAGSTGKLYAQIVNGAPFDLFLAADAERPRLLERSGHGVKGTRFTYAIGRLALHGRALRRSEDGERVLREASVRHFAIANSRTAPYGVAAEQVLRRAGVWDRYSDRLVRAENVAQSFQFVQSGGAELGLLALSTLEGAPSSTYWIVPESLHDPILQDALLLQHGSARASATQLLQFMRGPEARQIIEQSGYRFP